MKKKPLGVTIFGAILIWISLQRIPWLSFNVYHYYFPPLPEKIILIRYFISVSMGILELASGIGVLFLKDIFRKTALFISFLSILTVYWKHPFFVFLKIRREAIAKSGISMPENEVNSIAWGAVTIVSLLTIGFSIALIFYFTRSKIKNCLNKY